MIRLACAVLLVLPAFLHAQSGAITSVTPDVPLYPGDDVRYAIRAIFSGQLPNNNNVAGYELKEVSTKGERTIASQVSDARQQGLVTMSGQYVVPAQYCFDCPSRAYRISNLELTVVLYDKLNGVVIARSPARKIEVIYPSITSVLPASMPKQSEVSSGAIVTSGFAPFDLYGQITISYRHTSERNNQGGTQMTPPESKSVTCPTGQFALSFGAYFYPCDVQVSAASFSFKFFAYFLDSDTTGNTRLGTFDVVLQAAAPSRNVSATLLSPGLADAILPAGFTLTPAKTDDSTAFARLTIGGVGQSSREVNLTGENFVDLPAGASATLTVSPKFKLSRLGDAYLWCIVRAKDTGAILRAQDKVVENSRGTFATAAYSFGGGSFPVFFTLPASGSPIEVYLAFTPINRNMDGPYDEGQAFGMSSKIVISLGKPTVQIPTAPKPRQSTDSRFVVETGAGLKTACRKRSEGPLRIAVPVHRVIGEVDSLNRPLDRHPGTVVSSDVTLRLAVYHASIGGATSTPRDRFLMNGRGATDVMLGDEGTFLTGPNGVWTVNTVTFPSYLTLFGRRKASQPPGNPPDPGNNVIEIQVDPANSDDAASPESWCTVIDWVELSFDALAPVIFVHGNGQGDDTKGGEFWTGAVQRGDRTEPRLQMQSDVLRSFIEAGIPYDNSISMFTNTTEQHGDILGKIIPAIAREFGARHVHLIAHSKGGLDVRDFMARTMPDNFGVLSFTTFSSPHNGSAGPDYQLDAVHTSVAYSDDSTHAVIAWASPPGPGTDSLRVSTVAQFNQKNIPLMPRSMTVDGETKLVKYVNLVADANVDDSFTVFGNPTIEHFETEGIPGQPGALPDSGWASIVEQLYRILGNVASTRVELKPVNLEDEPGKTPFVMVPVVKETPTATFQPNDFCVTWASGTYLVKMLGGETHMIKANHSTVAGPRSAKIAIDAILASQPMK